MYVLLYILCTFCMGFWRPSTDGTDIDDDGEYGDIYGGDRYDGDRCDGDL